MRYLVVSLFILSIIFTSCRKDRILDDASAKLEFSTDTLTFDTVFTTVGSSTKSFKIFNPYNQRINISEIKLANGTASQFRINVDGVSGTTFSDIEIAPKDSMYVFVEVTVDPNNDNTPFIISDEVVFNTNGNIQDVKLTAYGQNAHFYIAPTDSVLVLCNETWVNDKPYVLRGTILLDENCQLTIQEGVRIYLHANTNLFVAGTLKMNGSADSFINLEGDRLEDFFDNLPGQWGSIVFLRGSKNNVIRNTRINESFSGIVIGSTTSSDLNDFNEANMPDVTLEKVEIKNAAENGIFSFFSKITATNLLVHSTGKNSVALLFGGEYSFTNSTIANYCVTGFEHKTPALRFTNFVIQDDVAHLRPLYKADFINTIVYGSIQMDTSRNAGEVAIDSIDAPGLPFNYYFSHSILKTNKLTTDAAHFNNIIKADPLFKMSCDNDDAKKDYGLKAGSPAINAGTTAVSVAEDLYSKPRTGIPDIGAIEAQ